MRTLGLSLFLLLSLGGMASCPRADEADEAGPIGVDESTPEASREEPTAAAPPGHEDSSSKEQQEGADEKGDATGGEQDDGLPNPERFAGFSGDETRFAYGALSKGAGVHIFTVVDSATGHRITDLPLADDEMRGLARRMLSEGGFSAESGDGAGRLRDGDTLRLEAEPGKVLVQLVRGDSVVELEAPEPMAAVAGRMRRPEVDLWGFSPSGTYIAVRITENQGEVLGEATTYQVLPLPSVP